MLCRLRRRGRGGGLVGGVGAHLWKDGQGKKVKYHCHCGDRDRRDHLHQTSDPVVHNSPIYQLILVLI